MTVVVAQCFRKGLTFHSLLQVYQMVLTSIYIFSIFYPYFLPNIDLGECRNVDNLPLNTFMVEFFCQSIFY